MALFPTIVISDLNEKGSNLPFSLHIMLIMWYFLVSEVFAKKMINSSVLRERKALGTSYEKEKRSNEASRASEAKTEEPKRVHG